MRFPKLNIRAQSREFIQEFGGLDRRTRISENCFSEMKNLTSDFYPALAPRKKRGIVGTVEKCNALMAGEKLAYVSGNTLYWGEDVTMELTAGEDAPRQLVMMGAYLVVFPDNMYLNTADTDDQGYFQSDSKVISGSSGEFAFTMYKYEDESSLVQSEENRIDYKDFSLFHFTLNNGEEVQIYDQYATYDFVSIGDRETLTGIPNPNHQAFSFYETRISGDGIFEIVGGNADSFYMQVKGTSVTSGIAYLVMTNTRTQEKYTYAIATGCSQKQIAPSNRASSFQSEYSESGKTVLYYINASGARVEQKSVLRIRSEVFERFPNGVCEGVVITTQLKGLYDIPYLRGVPSEPIQAVLQGDSLWIEGALLAGATFDTDTAWAESGYTVTIELTAIVPIMDHVIESQNRLWGCRYGLNANGELVNEIYASALGDFRQWYTFAGISTDSYAASVGISGPFTGAINYRGYPLFFKENAMFKVYGDYPENYQIVSDTGMGVQKGCDKSLFVLSNVLYYKSPDGIFAYDGSTNERIDAVLGSEYYTDVVCGGTGTKLWISMEGENSEHSGIYVCDIEKGLWHREDTIKARYMARYGNDVYIADAEGRLFTVNGSAGDTESGEVSFFAETGVIGYSTPDSKYVSRFALRVAVPHDGSLQIFVEYDSANVWEFKGSIEGNGMRTFTVPVVPRLCDHFRIRLVGKGNCRIFGFSKVLEEGGTV